MTKNYFYNLLLSISNILFPILSFPYVSRVIGPEGIGKVQFIFSFSQYFALVASIGIPIYGMKEIARHRDDLEGRSKIFSELIAVYLFTSVCLSVIYLMVICSFPYFKADREMYIAATCMVLLSFSHIEWLYTGMEEFRSITVRSVVFKLIGLLLLFFFIKERTDYTLYLYIMMFSFLGNNVLSLFLIRNKVKLVFSGLSIRKHIRPLLYILGTTLAASMYTDMDTVLLGFLSDDHTVGLYTAAVKLSKITLPFVTSMAVILVPKISKNFAEHQMEAVQETLDETFRFLAFFAVPVVFGLALLAPEFIALFSGEEFLPATNSMRLLSALPLIIGFGHFFLFLILVPSGKNREMFFCVLGGLVVSLVLNVVLIPFYQEVGSSVANICSELLVTLLYFYFIQKYFKFSYEWSLLFKGAMSAILFIPVVWGVRELHAPLLVSLLLSVLGCVIVYFIMQWFIFSNKFIFDIAAFMKTKLNFNKED